MRRVLAVPLLASTLMLAGCILVPASAPGGDRPDDDRLDIPAPSCDGPAFLNSPNTHYDLGNCDEVTVEGEGISVDASDIGTLTIRGDDIEVDAASIGDIDIAGQDNFVSGAAIGSLDINGDRNEVEADGDIGTVGGNDNTVTGTAIESVSDQGDGNVVEPD